MRREISLFRMSINALSLKCPVPRTLDLVLKKDLKFLHQNDAYEILMYLINTCRKEGKFKSFGEDTWKIKNGYSKIDIEKLRKDVLQDVKNLSLEGKVRITVLKKSDLVVPYCSKFFNCCIQLCDYAFSFQLSLMGTVYWSEMPRVILPELSDEIMRYILSEKEAMIEEVRLFRNKNEELGKHEEYLRSELAVLSSLKTDLEHDLNKLIDTCIYLNKDSLRNKNTRFKYLAQASKEVDKLFFENKQKLDSLKELNDNVSYLNNLLESRRNKKVIIDGKELYANISYECKTFAAKENIKLFVDGSLNLQSLSRVVLKSFESCSEGSLHVSRKTSKLLDVKLPGYEPNLLSRLERMEEKLHEKLDELKCSLGQNLDKSEVERWFEDFSTPIPTINFDLNGELDSKYRRDPIVDTNRIEKLINSKNINGKKADNSCTSVVEVASQVSQSNPSESWKYKYLLRKRNSSNSLLSIARSGSANSFNLRNLRRLSSSSNSLLTDVSPVSTVIRESTKIWERKSRRRSRSSGNLLSGLSSITVDTNGSIPNGSPDSNLSRKEQLSSTPKVEVFFEGDKSISPIFMHPYCGYFDSSRTCRSSDASNGPFLEGFHESYDSTPNHNTFDSAGFPTEISFDSVAYPEEHSISDE